MMKYFPSLFLLLLTTLVFTSCDKDEPDIIIEEEVITTLIYTLTPDGTGTPVEMSFKDLDGDGGNEPVIVSGTLAANQTYTGSLELLNEQESPAEDITAEILEAAAEHQFFFINTVSGTTINYDDQDAMGNPLGLKSKLTTTDAGSGTLTIILRHEPNKTAAGVSAGTIDNAGGETDIEVVFSVDVQ